MHDDETLAAFRSPFIRAVEVVTILFPQARKTTFHYLPINLSAIASERPRA